MHKTGIRYKELARTLRHNGFVESTSNGTTHVKWIRGSESLVVRKPSTNRMVWRRLCKEHNIT